MPRKSRITPGVAVVLAAILVAVVYGFYVVLRPPASTSMTVADLQELQQDAARHPNDVDRAMDLLVGYTSLLNQFSDLEKATRGTLDMVRENPAFAAKPEIQEKKQFIETEWAKFQAKIGIQSQEHKKQLLAEGIAHADKTLARTDLDKSQRSGAHLARGRLWLAKGDPRKALADAQNVADPVMRSLLKADAHTDSQNWSAAITELRGASLALTAWANREPGWETKIWWSMRRGRAWRKERRWKERRGEIARNIRFVIADEIRVLQGLQKLDQMRGGSDKAAS